MHRMNFRLKDKKKGEKGPLSTRGDLGGEKEEEGSARGEELVLLNVRGLANW